MWSGFLRCILGCSIEVAVLKLRGLGFDVSGPDKQGTWASGTIALARGPREGVLAKPSLLQARAQSHSYHRAP